LQQRWVARRRGLSGVRWLRRVRAPCRRRNDRLRKTAGLDRKSERSPL
jgi:hypothetical protein